MQLGSHIVPIGAGDSTRYIPVLFSAALDLLPRLKPLTIGIYRTMKHDLNTIF